MTLIALFLSSLSIGFSGALMPGPLLGVTINGGLKRGVLSGVLIATGHALLELITVILLIIGLKDVLNNNIVSGIIGFFGGLVLIYMGINMIKSVVKDKITIEGSINKDKGEGKYILSGVVVSLSNPYFAIWWASVGLALITKSMEFGILGIGAVYLGHILSDYCWFTFVAYAISKGKKIINDKVYRSIIMILGIFLICFALYFIKSGLGFLDII